MLGVKFFFSDFSIKTCWGYSSDASQQCVSNEYSTDSGSQFLLTLAFERYTIYFDIGRKPGCVCI